jgi:hypothetical protein
MLPPSMEKQSAEYMGANPLGQGQSKARSDVQRLKLFMDGRLAKFELNERKE